MRVLAAAIVSVLLCASCRGQSAAAASGGAADVTLPGVDTGDFTPREKHEFSRYVQDLPSPCASLAVPLSQCVIEKRACAPCLSATQSVAQGVREGLSESQVRERYQHRFDPAGRRTIDLEGSPSRGPEAAPVTIVEFADFECPFCQKMAVSLDSLCEKHHDVRFVYKFLPLAMHPHGEDAARAAIAAQAQGKFWEMHHALFTNHDRLEKPDLEGYAKKEGLDVARFEADMGSEATTARIARDKKLADDLGVKGTPSIYVNGRDYDARDQDLETWIESELADAGGASPAGR